MFKLKKPKPSRFRDVSISEKHKKKEKNTSNYLAIQLNNLHLQGHAQIINFLLTNNVYKRKLDLYNLRLPPTIVAIGVETGL